MEQIGKDHFNYKEIDREGASTLETISAAKRFNRWMYDVISKHCSGKILEVGSGIGNISNYFISEGADIVLSDIRENYCDYLRKTFQKSQVEKLDLVDADFSNQYAHLLSSFDTVFALNVVEHIEDDVLALSNIKKLLKPGGVVVILVPAFQSLYNSFDKELYHYRRYSRKSLKQIVDTEFEVRSSRYFNPVGIIGWFINGSLLKKKEIPSDQMKHFDKLVPIFRMIDFFTQQVIGLSVITVGYKAKR